MVYCSLKQDKCEIVTQPPLESKIEEIQIDPRVCLTCPFYQPYLRVIIEKRPHIPPQPPKPTHPDIEPVRPRFDRPTEV